MWRTARTLWMRSMSGFEELARQLQSNMEGENQNKANTFGGEWGESEYG